MKKRIFTVSLVIALAAILLVGGTMAYFTDTKAKCNCFTIGNVKICLEEPKWDFTSPEDHKDVYPGEELGKDPQVKNWGANPAFIRLKVSGLDCLKLAGLSKEDIELIGLNTTDWTYYDGYYYYNQPLDPGATTPALFQAIKIPTDTTNYFGFLPFDVMVVAEAVQSEGSNATTVPEIAAWFTVCGF